MKKIIFMLIMFSALVMAFNMPVKAENNKSQFSIETADFNKNFIVKDDSAPMSEGVSYDTLFVDYSKDSVINKNFIKNTGLNTQNHYNIFSCSECPFILYNHNSPFISDIGNIHKKDVTWNGPGVFAVWQGTERMAVVSGIISSTNKII